MTSLTSLSTSQLLTLGANAYDPLAWAGLITWTNCTGVSTDILNQFSCKFPATPPDSKAPGFSWTCPAGQFCVGASQVANCTAGFYCPGNSIEPIYCPQSYYCSNDTTTITICPVGKYCPIGTVIPKSCGVLLANCPIGSYDAPKFLVVLVFAVIAAAIWFLYQWKDRADVAREQKRRRQLEESAMKARLDSKPDLEKLEKTFTIEFQDLGLKLANGVEIMKGVSGTLYSGRTCAIMGPSGCGKTTFVNLVTGKAARTSGTIKLNGNVDELSHYSKLVGMVPQEDIMLREMNVRDILMHSARSRLSKHKAYPQVKAKVNEIITFLGMAHVANSIIGNEEERGVSGGQRKRVNIGMELCAEPSVLFLDEPTSGLDSSTSYDVCQNLRMIAIAQGLTVAAVIHSPSPATFRQFDDFLLLGKGGRVIYMGPREGALGYFATIGFTCPPTESPSDYYMDVVTGVIPSEFEPGFKPTDLLEYWDQRKDLKTIFGGRERMSYEAAVMAAKEFHRITPTLKKEDKLAAQAPVAVPKPRDIKSVVINFGRDIIDSFYKGLISFGSDTYDFGLDIGTELFTSLRGIFRYVTFTADPVRDVQPLYFQTWYLVKRAFGQVYRNVHATLVDLAMNFAAGVFISVAIQGMGYLGGAPGELCDWAPTNVYYLCINPQDQLRVAGMFICLGSMFAGISIAGNTFGKEKVVYWRDTAAGMPVIPYYFAKMLVDIPRVILGATTYFIALIMFFPYAQGAAHLYAVILMMHFYSFAIGYAISTAVPFEKLSLYGVGMALLWSLVLSGVAPDIENVNTYPSVIRWVWGVSAPRWMIEAFYLREVDALPFVEKFHQPGPGPYIWANYYPDFQNSIVITIGWHILALLGLKLFNRIKQK